MQPVVERLLWIATACGMPIKSVSERSRPDMQGDLRLEERLCDKLLLILEQSLVILKRPLLKPAIRAKRLERCRMLVNDLKSSPAGRDLDGRSYEKPKKLPLLVSWEEDESSRTLPKTKRPASVM